MYFKINFEIQNYYENEAKFNGFYPRSNLAKMKDGELSINQ